jgi:hypothetical protein
MGWQGLGHRFRNKFTFSAAIVFVALLKDRLKHAVALIGEKMGDQSNFFAEGDTVELENTGAAVRYSTAYHDWNTGLVDPTTPCEIATHLVAAGDLRPDHHVDISAGDVRSGHDPQLDAALVVCALG